MFMSMQIYSICPREYVLPVAAIACVFLQGRFIGLARLILLACTGLGQ